MGRGKEEEWKGGEKQWEGKRRNVGGRQERSSRRGEGGGMGRRRRWWLEEKWGGIEIAIKVEPKGVSLFEKQADKKGFGWDQEKIRDRDEE